MQTIGHRKEQQVGVYFIECPTGCRVCGIKKDGSLLCLGNGCSWSGYVQKFLTTCYGE